MVFPPTWTPSPTFTPAPPTATATLVIQDTPIVTRTASPAATNFRRYPAPANGTLGLWVDTTDLSPDLLASLAPRAQLLSGQQVAAARQANSHAFTLARLDVNKSDNLVSNVQQLARSYDGILVEPTSADSLDAANALLASLRGPLGSRLLIASTYAWHDGASYAQHSADAQKLLARVDGACLCDFLRVGDAPLDQFKTEAEWKQDVDALAALSQSPNALVLVATRFAKVSNDTASQLAPWLDYALASYLLGADAAHTYFSFQGPHAADYLANDSLAPALGYAVSKYYQSYGLYARNFQKGLVLVNPGEYAREMPLGRTYTTTSGEQVTSAKLEPHAGLILLIAEQ
jgi:hypothetical protein